MAVDAATRLVTVAILALGCAAPAKRRQITPAKPMPRQLTLAAPLVEIVEVKWRDRTIDRDALGAMIAGHHEYATRERFKARFGLDYDKAFRVFMFGYAAQLAERFNFVPREMGITDDHGRWLVVVWGSRDGELVEWKNGVVTPRGPDHSIKPTPPPKTLETVIASENGAEYWLAALGAVAYFRARDNEPTSDRIYRGEVLRTYLEPIHYVDANGRRFTYQVPIERATPYVRVKPGGFKQLTGDLHVVRIDLDQTAQPGSQILIDSFTVLDGTKDIASLGPAYKTLWTRFNNDRLAAMAKIARETAAMDATFVKNANEWARKQTPSQPLEADKRDYNTTLPTYKWDAATKTLTVSFKHKYSVIVVNRIPYPNPEMANFRCPAGAACAVPPQNAYHTLEQRYDVLLDVTYEIDHDATVRTREIEGPHIVVAR